MEIIINETRINNPVWQEIMIKITLQFSQGKS